MGVFPDLKPRPLTPGQFRRSNVFVAYSRKLDRSVDLIGPTLHDAWLMLEFDPGVAWFCERPPHDIDLLPLEGKQRPIDFWVCEVSGRNAQIIVYCPEVAQDKKISLDLLKRSIAASKMNCQVWMGADLQRRRTYLRNLKQLQPFLAEQGARDHSLGDKIMSCVRANGEVRWVDVMSSVKAWSPPSVNREVAYLIHQGQLTADLASQPLTMNTALRSA
jgi:hypothetical protein